MEVLPEIQSFLNNPLSVGGKTVQKRLLVSPMAGFTHVAFRELMEHFGGYGLLSTEMCSAKAVPNENPLHSKVFRWQQRELPHLVCQIFGSRPDVMAAAARRVEAEGFFGVDINFGCSVAAVCKKNAGAALLKTPETAAAIVSAVRGAVEIPVSVKFRTGWTDDPKPAIEMARRFEDAGADALTFHPRVAPDRRTRPPRWEYIGMIKQAVNIPVFGNGDVFDAKDCVRMIQNTGCDGVSVGRIVLACPWMPALWTSGIAAGNEVYHFSARRMMELLSIYFEPVTALRRFKKWALFFAAGFKYGHRFSAEIRAAKNAGDIFTTVDRFFENTPERSARPNMNMFR